MVDMNEFHNTMDSILAKNNLPNDTESIRRAMEQTQVDIQEAVLDGNGSLMVELGERMRVLSARAFGASVSETKAAIEKNDARKGVIAKEVDALREIKGLRNRQLGRAMMVVNRRQVNVNKVQFAIELAENELESIRVGNREMKKRLDDMKQTKLREVENGQFRTIFHETRN